MFGQKTLICAIQIFSSMLVSLSGSNLIAPKCCPINESFDKKNHICEPVPLEFNPDFWLSPVSEIDPSDYEDNEIGLIIGNPCQFGSYRLEPHIDSEDEFHLLPNGSLFVPYHQTSLLSPTDYCLESFDIDGKEVVVLPLVCFTYPPESPFSHHHQQFQYNLSVFPIGSFLSSVLSFAILPAHLSLTRRSLRNAIITGYCLSSAITFGLLTVVEVVHETISEESCLIICHLIQFCFICNILWTNVIMHETLHRVKASHGYGVTVRSHLDHIQFRLYLTYVLSASFSLSFYTYIMDIVPISPIIFIKWTSWFKAYCLGNANSTIYINCYVLMILTFVSNVSMLLLAFRHLYHQTKQVLNCSRTRIVYARTDVSVHLTVLLDSVNVIPKTDLKESILFLAPYLNCVVELTFWIWDEDSWPDSWLLVDVCNFLQAVVVVLVYLKRKKIDSVSNSDSLSGVHV